MNRNRAIFVHGAGFHGSAWDRWAERFTAFGFDVRAPTWPSLRLEELAGQVERMVRDSGRPPVVIGHGVGGLIAQHLIGRGLGSAAVAIAPQPVPGRTPDGTRTRLSPLFWTDSAEPDFALFRDTVANTVGAEEAEKLFKLYAVPVPRILLADFRQSPIRVDTDNDSRGPLLLISGQEDRVVPDAVTRAAYKLYGDCTAVTNLKQFPDRGHSLIVDSGWHQVADYALTWLAANGVGPAA